LKELVVRIASLFLALVVAATAFMACEDDTSLAPLGSVSATGVIFSPDTVILTPTEMVVTWGFLANAPHSVTFEDGAPGSGGRVTGAWSRDFTGATSGPHRYRCDYHSTSYTTGMVGVVIVP
jgi:plastocyanin